jgi:hypothetical protein
LYLHAVDKHAEVLADRDQRRVLVVKLHAQRSFSGRRRDEFGLTKVRSTQAHSGL